jgi:hypothetical protein
MEKVHVENMIQSVDCLIITKRLRLRAGGKEERKGRALAGKRSEIREEGDVQHGNCCRKRLYIHR